MPNPPRPTKLDVQRAARVIAASKSYPEAARKLGVSIRTLYNARKSNVALDQVKPQSVEETGPVVRPAPKSSGSARSGELPPEPGHPVEPSSLDLPGAPQELEDVEDDEIIGALEKTGGNIAMSAKVLGVSSLELRKRVRRSHRLFEVQEEEGERTTDMMEARARQIALRGKPEDGTPATRVSLQAIQGHLQTKGANRGYIQHKVALTSEDRRAIFRTFLHAISFLSAEDQRTATERWERRWLDAANAAGSRWAQDQQ